MRIIVATDGSECSLKAVEFVIERPWTEADEFLVLTVVEPVPDDFGLSPALAPGESGEDALFRLSVDITTRVGSKIQKHLPDNQVEAKVLNGNIVEQICKCASQWSADMILIGSHGRKGFQHFLLGSVAEDVLKKSPCSVQVIKPKEKVKEDDPATASGGGTNPIPCAG